MCLWICLNFCNIGGLVFKFEGSVVILPTVLVQGRIQRPPDEFARAHRDRLLFKRHVLSTVLCTSMKLSY